MRTAKEIRADILNSYTGGTKYPSEIGEMLDEYREVIEKGQLLPIDSVVVSEAEVCEHKDTFYQNIQTDHVYCGKCDKDLGKQT